VDRKMSLAEIGLVYNSLGIALSIVGALAGGWFVTRFGLFRGILWLGLSQTAAILVYASVAAFPLPRDAMYIASSLESLAQGLGTAAFLSFLTGCCERENAATQYALLSALFSFSREISGAFSGWAADRFGYADFFLGAAVLSLPALALLPLLRPRIVSFERRAA